MKNGLFRKGFVHGIIILFICIAFQPVINAYDTFESDNSELVEIKIQICKGYEAYDYAVMLSKGKAKELESLISRTKTDLDAAKTLEETSAIFNDTVLSLYEFGVLPKGISIEYAQRLVNGMERNSRIFKILERLYSRNQGNLDDNENILCLIAGETDETSFVRAGFFLFLQPFFEWLIELESESNLRILGLLIWMLGITALFFILFPNFNPLSIGYTICLGRWSPYVPPDHVPASGWIHTIGLNGIKNWNGSFFGKLSEVFEDAGVFGFTGLKISYLTTPFFYMGAALWLKIENV